MPLTRKKYCKIVLVSAHRRITTYSQSVATPPLSVGAGFLPRACRLSAPVSVKKASAPDLKSDDRAIVNRSEQFELYSYVIKVQADFDVGLFLKSDVSEAADCPEGNVPAMDSHAQTYLQVASERCAQPSFDGVRPIPPREHAGAIGRTSQ